MNVDTGHLVNANYAPDGYDAIPKHLEKDAKKLLGDNREAFVNLSSYTNLSRWAYKKRKNKMNMSKQSRKQNRGK